MTMLSSKILLLVACALVFTHARNLNSGRCVSTKLSDSINALGSELVNNLEEQGNYFVSPMSIHAALSMTYLGATSNTAKEMEKAFRLKSNGENDRKLHEAYGKLLEAFGITNDNYNLMVANGVFVQEDYKVKDNYVSGLKSYYKAAFKALNFRTSGDMAKNEINKWVAQNTENKIEELLSDPLDPATKLALLNAVYFKGTWKVQFDKEATYDAPFMKRDRTTKFVKFMHLHKERFPFYEDQGTGYKFLEMPYKGEHVSMLLALPGKGQFIPKLEMTSSILCELRQSLLSTKLEWVKIPKFHLEYSTELKKPLQKMGIERLFTGAADLDGMSDAGDLFVSSVLHKAVIDVNEEGSEAAAVTGVIIENRMGSFNKPEFVANRPFLFYIFDKRSNIVLFTGRVSNP